MKIKEDLQSLRARARALEARLSFLDWRIREIERGPRPLFPQVWIDPEKCLGCGLCEANCPAAAIFIEKTARVLPGRCIRCGRCLQICPQGAISLRVGALENSRRTVNFF